MHAARHAFPESSSSKKNWMKKLIEAKYHCRFTQNRVVVVLLNNCIIVRHDLMVFLISSLRVCDIQPQCATDTPCLSVSILRVPNIMASLNGPWSWWLEPAGKKISVDTWQRWALVNNGRWHWAHGQCPGEAWSGVTSVWWNVDAVVSSQYTLVCTLSVYTTV